VFKREHVGCLVGKIICFDINCISITHY